MTKGVALAFEWSHSDCMFRTLDDIREVVIITAVEVSVTRCWAALRLSLMDRRRH